MTLTKAKIVERIYSNTDFSKRESGELLETMLNIIKENLCSGNNVKIAGLGQFTVKKKASRVGRNPQTGNKMKIESRTVVTFKPSKILKKEITTRYAHRIDKNGHENMEISPRTQESQALNYFALNNQQKEPTNE